MFTFMLKSSLRFLTLALACMTTTVMAETPPMVTGVPKNLTKITMCVFDFVGQDGPIHKAMKEFLPEYTKMGVDLSFKVYTDDRVASEEFKNGACDTNKSLVAMSTAEMKQNISTYMYTSTAKIGSFIKESDDRSSRAVGNVEYWMTDYALLELVANRLMSTLTLTNAFTPLWIFDPGQLELVYLIGPNTTAPAPDGLVDVRWTSAYWGTRFHPEACAGIVGINSATAMAA